MNKRLSMESQIEEDEKNLDKYHKKMNNMQI